MHFFSDLPPKVADAILDFANKVEESARCEMVAEQAREKEVKARTELISVILAAGLSEKSC